MSGQRNHPHVPDSLFTPLRPIPTLPLNTDDFLDQVLASPPGPPLRLPTLRELDSNNVVQASLTASAQQPLQQQPTMSTADERIAALTALAERQQKQIEEGNAFANRAAQQLQDSQRQLEASQQAVSDLTRAFNDLAAQPRPLTVSSAPKKKPDLPPFDSKNVLVWIRRVEAAYSRVGVVEPKDKFAWMEAIFQVKIDPQIDAFLYTSNNTAQNWTDFIEYLKLQYGPTVRQKAQKLMGEIPRHDLTPSQYLVQLNDDTKDVTIDQIKREHLLKTIPPRIREIMGKEVETMTAEEVAKAADTFFDRNGRPLEKQTASINHVASQPTRPSTPFSSRPSAASSMPSTLSSTTTAPPASFTAAYSDEESDVNHVKGGNFRNSNRGRSRSRAPRSQSRPGSNRFNNNSSTANGNSNEQKSSFPPGTCRWHRLFGEKSRKCVTDCPRFKSFNSSQQSGNGQGGRRM